MTGLFSLQGKTILVTGASRGLGWAIAREMARAGGTLVLNGRHEETLRPRVDALVKEGYQASGYAFDVTDESAGAAAIAGIAGRHGGLDVLVLNAGIQHRQPFVEFSTDDYRRVIETNLTACFVLAREAARAMTAKGAGRIIMIGSIMGQVARPTIPAYTASKGAVMALTKALAVELGPQGITCNAIAPGFFATEMNTALTEDPAFSRFVRERTPLGRWGQPEEIAGAAVFLASAAGAYVNGHVLTIDGGLVVNA